MPHFNILYYAVSHYTTGRYYTVLCYLFVCCPVLSVLIPGEGLLDESCLSNVGTSCWRQPRIDWGCGVWEENMSCWIPSLFGRLFLRCCCLIWPRHPVWSCIELLFSQNLLRRCSMWWRFCSLRKCPHRGAERGLITKPPIWSYSAVSRRLACLSCGAYS